MTADDIPLLERQLSALKGVEETLRGLCRHSSTNEANDLNSAADDAKFAATQVKHIISDLRYP